ncbi:MAG: prepilin-type N-terminal cleavage/methylation domain-containing protein [Patescibacteria group bacterium]|jgi:prepilin-type N-terminal cleavage/methylation domain-containing protein|nr:prepilin-type N-terminal cleavage/methylation domain-containing protein [Patescibacteria group bacterium]
MKVIKLNKFKKAFSLIEVMVSVAIFSVIILITSQIFSLTVNAQRNAIASQNVQESLKYFLEVVAKEIRMALPDDSGVCGVVPGEIYDLTEGETGDTLKFKNYEGECVIYTIDVDDGVTRFQIVRDGNTGYISPFEIEINHLDFELDSDLLKQALVTVNIEAEALNLKDSKSQMTIQTSVSSRYYK